MKQRQAGQTEELVTQQTKAALEGISHDDIVKVVIAYEPIWAIGTGLASDGRDANRVIGLIRKTVSGLYGEEKAGKMRIQYGGSVKPDNIKEFMQEPEIDGALVGGASLNVDSFTAIVKYA